jgi:hypothetical protein
MRLDQKSAGGCHQQGNALQSSGVALDSQLGLDNVVMRPIIADEMARPAPRRLVAWAASLYKNLLNS